MLYCGLILPLFTQVLRRDRWYIYIIIAYRFSFVYMYIFSPASTSILGSDSSEFRVDVCLRGEWKYGKSCLRIFFCDKYSAICSPKPCLTGVGETYICT